MHNWDGVMVSLAHQLGGFSNHPRDNLLDMSVRTALDWSR